MGFVHQDSTRVRFWELVCLEGWALDPAAKNFGAGAGSATRWWRRAFGMDYAINLGPVGWQPGL